MSTVPASPSSRLSDAQTALQRGFAVLPLWWMRSDHHCACGQSDCGSPGKHPLGPLVPHGEKDATHDAKKVGKWWAAFPEANIGTACGSKSGIIVLDVDPRNGGLESLEKLQAVCGKLVETFRVWTPGTEEDGRGRHYYFKYSAKLLAVLKAACGSLDGLDVLADGKQVVSPGSNHQTGLEYEIVGSPIAACEERAFQPLATAGPRLLEKPAPLPSEPGTVDADNALVDHCNKLRGTIEGERNNYLAKTACWDMGPYVRDNDIAEERVAAQLLSAAKASGLGHQESVATISSALRSAIQNNWPPPEAEGFSDDDLALMFSKEHAADLRFVDEWKKWMQWGGAVWASDLVLEVWDLTRRLCRDVAVGQTKAAIKQIKAAKTRAAVENMARSDKRHAVTSDIWDCDDRLLNTGSGTLEGKNKMVKFREHRREDYITKVCPINYNPQATCPRWMQFLGEVTCGDKALEDYLQRMAGYFLTGFISEQKLFFLYGKGGNGKGVFMSALESVLGGGPDGYCKTATPETFLESMYDRHPTEVAYLRGARLVLVPDMPEGRGWNMERIKSFTGGDTLTTRFMRGDFWSFTPQFKLLIAGNNKPSLRNVNEAIKRRFVLIPFRATPAKPDKDLLEKLRAEAEGICLWMVKGCQAWQVHGLEAPPVILEATEQYLTSQDPLSEWLESASMPETGKTITTGEAWGRWCRWCKVNEDQEPGTRNKFSVCMENAGYPLWRGTGGTRMFRGLRWLKEGETREQSRLGVSLGPEGEF